ncbi:MAG: 50S ribosomal protein L17 [Alphaproteobacteria bacterium]|nr:50S ribosomal protein L17 [Rickettsiales bacterium]
MKHGKKYKKLCRRSEHRLSLLNNMVCSLLLSNKIVTTITKAKSLRPYLEREFITPIKRNSSSLAVTRPIRVLLKNKTAFEKLIDLSVKFKDRKGGYSRIIKLGRRASDQAEMALIEFVE